jgi:predicted nucleic acid-binding protein
VAEYIFLDTNVFMYAAGAPHSYKDACVRILSAVESGALTAAINTEILQEILYRYTHIKLAGKGVQLCRDILTLPLTILPVTEADIRLAVDLFDAHRVVGLKPRDAIHVATMQNNSLSRLISADVEFDRLSAVTRIEPLAYTAIP